MPDCERTQEMISRFDELTDREKAEVEAHCASCAHCADMLAVFSEISLLMEEDAEPPVTLKDNVMAAVREINAEKKPKKTYTPWYRWAAVAASLALVSFAAIRLIPAFMPANSAAPSAMKFASAPSAAEEYAYDEAESFGTDGFSMEDQLNTSMFASPMETNADNGVFDNFDLSVDVPTAEPAPEAAEAEDAPAAGNPFLGAGLQSVHNANTADPSADTATNSEAAKSGNVVLLVWYDAEGEAEVRRFIEENELEIVYDYENFNSFAISVPAEQREEITAELAKLPAVLSVEEDQVVTID